MDDPGRQRRRRVRTIGALSAVLCSLLLAGGAPAAEEPTIFTMGSAMHAVGVTVGPEGNLWFAATSSASSQDPGAVGRVDPDGKVVEFGLEGKSGAQAIVAGPDGNLWFTEPSAGRIGRVTVAGTITTFPLPDPDSRPGAIAAGPDGNLWFTEAAGDRIGRIAPAGAIAEFPLASGSKPAGIVAGPDGNLWFTELGLNRIGRISPSGQIAEFPLAGGEPRPDRITVGPDGNLWFTYDGANSIGRITATGEVAEFPLPILSAAWAISAGPDGNVWFSSNGQVGAIAPNGRLARLTCLKSSCRLPAISLAAGIDGALWAGTSTEYPAYGGGGSYINTNLTQPGYIARFVPRSSTTELTSGASPVRHRLTRLWLSCGSAAGCHGVLRLTRQRAVFSGETGANSAVVPIGRGRYDLDPGERASVLAGLNRRGVKLLAKSPLRAWALAEATGGDLETARLVTLQRPGRR
jgi:streptogramin lyase